MIIFNFVQGKGIQILSLPTDFGYPQDEIGKHFSSFIGLWSKYVWGIQEPAASESLEKLKSSNKMVNRFLLFSMFLNFLALKIGKS